MLTQVSKAMEVLFGHVLVLDRFADLVRENGGGIGGIGVVERLRTCQFKALIVEVA